MFFSKNILLGVANDTNGHEWDSRGSQKNVVFVVLVVDNHNNLNNKEPIVIPCSHRGNYETHGDIL